MSSHYTSLTYTAAQSSALRHERSRTLNWVRAGSGYWTRRVSPQPSNTDLFSTSDLLDSLPTVEVIKCLPPSAPVVHEDGLPELVSSPPAVEPEVEPVVEHRSTQSAPLLTLPMELHIHILSFIAPESVVGKATWNADSPKSPPATTDLLVARLTCRALAAAANAVLRPILDRDLPVITLAEERALVYREGVEADAREPLAHNRRFLRTLSTAHLSELASMKRPPREVVQVAACLAALMGTGKSSSGSVARLRHDASSVSYDGTSWTATRRALARPEARAWLAALHTRLPPAVVNPVGVEAARAALVAMGISYERMQEVSMAGYRALIVVAACIQYCEHAGRVEAAKKAHGMLERRVGQVRKLAEALGCRAAVEAVEVEGDELAHAAE
ncbi:hypothetical protein H9P43_001794 [Blastocladiella emersonii ATCC 22665]|nr:hypothetical protein H9P43_001794 [Blastocladiella emersonii ATCC 22665]